MAFSFLLAATLGIVAEAYGLVGWGPSMALLAFELALALALAAFAGGSVGRSRACSGVSSFGIEG